LGTGYLGMNGLQKGGSHSRLGMRPLGRGDSAAAIVVAATGASDDELSGFPDQLRSLRSVARMNRPADAARMRRRSGSRHSQRAKVAHKRDQQQKSGDQSMHGWPKVLEAYQFSDTESNKSAAEPAVAVVACELFPSEYDLKEKTDWARLLH